MKKFVFALFVFSVCSLAGYQKVTAQEDVLNALNSQLSVDEKKQMDQAKLLVKKAQEFVKKANENDKKTDKYFAKKKKNAEAKASPAKKLRVDAALNYQKAYDIAYKIYDQKLKSCNYQFEDDQQLAENLKSQAEENVKSSDEKLKNYSNKKEADLKKITYSVLKNDLTTAYNLRTSGLKSQIDAYTLWQGQSDKAKKMEGDEIKAWQTAQQRNTEGAYNDYIKAFPKGKNVKEAAAKIGEIKEAQRIAEEKEKELQKGKGLVYKIQIAASKVQLNNYVLVNLYAKTSEIAVRQVDGYYKYSVGEFKAYEEAKKFKSKLKARGAFIVAFNNDTQLNIVEAKALENKK